MNLSSGKETNQFDYFTNLAAELSLLKDRVSKLEGIQRPETYQDVVLPPPIRTFHSPRMIRNMLEAAQKHKKDQPGGNT